MIGYEQARGIAAQWHGGQATALYAFASTGTIQRRVLREIDDNLQGTESARAVKDLRALAEYCRTVLGEHDEVFVL